MMESQILRWVSSTAEQLPFFKVSVSEKKVLAFGRWLLCGLIFFSIFVPRFSIGSIASSYSLDVRTEDFLLLILGILVFGMTRSASLPEIPWVEKAFLGFLIAAQVSILNGFFMRTIDKPLMSLLYFLKWTEYFLIFILAARLTVGQKESDFFLKAFFLLGIAVACFGYWEYFFPASKAVYPNYYRLFERPPFHGDANHIGGLLVLWMGVFTGFFLKTEKNLQRWFFLAALVFVFFPFIWTYSRKSYFSLAGAFLFSFLFVGERRKLLSLTCLLVILGLVFPTRLAERLLDLGEAFTSTDPFHSSWAGDLSMWEHSLWNFQRFFLFGSGLGSRHRLYYESQYVLVLAETGLVGLIAFVLLCLSLIRGVLFRLRQSLGAKDRALALGWLIGFVGLLIHNFSCVSWTVSKIAIPFWFLTAFVLARHKRATA